MNTTTLIIGIVVVVVLLILIAVAVGLQRRKSKTVSFEKPAEQEPKELTQEEKSGNYQAQGGFNFAPAKSAEKEPEVLPGQELGSSAAGATAAGAAGAASAAAAAGAMKGEQDKPDTRIQPDEARQAPEKAADTAQPGGAVGPGEDGATAAAAGTPRAEQGEPDTSAAQSPEDSLTAEAEAGDLAAAETVANEDNYQVVSEADPVTPEDTPAPVTPEDTPAPVTPETEEPVEVSPEVADHLEEIAPVDAEPVSDAPVEPSPATPDTATPDTDRDPAAVLPPVESVTEPVEVAPETVPEAAAESAAEDVDTRSPEETEEVAEEAAEAAQVTAEVAEAAREQTPVPDTPAEPAPEPLDDIAPVAGRLGQLRSRLSRSQNVIGQGVLGILTAGDLDEDAWEEIEDTLIMADLGTTVTMKVVDSLRDKIAERGVSNEAEARSMLRETLIEAARPELDRSIKAMPYEGKPAVVLVVGVNGTGKTTTTGKLARVLVSMGHKVLLGAADTFRAAAADQLETWGDRVGARTVRGAEGADPASVAFDAVAQGVTDQADVVLIDTAGRLHTSTGLMDQLGKVKRVVEKRTDVDEVLLVLDATVGQNGLIQARTFREVVDISGVVLTKLDGTAKGGIVFQVQEELGVPVKLVGLGEGADHLAPFEVESFVDALLG